MNWSWLLPAGKGIPVLMYHKVWPNRNDNLAITPDRLREHWAFLRDEGYNTLSMHGYLEIITGQMQATSKAILITFDDGYRNNLTYVYPLLKEFGWKATFFIIANTLETTKNTSIDEAEQKMSLEELQLLDPAIVQLGLHGYDHEDMNKINLKEMQTEVINSVTAFENSKLQFSKVFAYPYGARPSERGDFKKLKQLMADIGIKAAFRIGNKVSKVPAPDIFEIKRIDIKGTDTIETLKIKLLKGKLKPF
ncbi:MAG: polysaccharide deacetylase family protein [Chitinophagales bacterium]